MGSVTARPGLWGGSEAAQWPRPHLRGPVPSPPRWPCRRHRAAGGVTRVPQTTLSLKHAPEVSARAPPRRGLLARGAGFVRGAGFNERGGVSREGRGFSPSCFLSCWSRQNEARTLVPGGVPQRAGRLLLARRTGSGGRDVGPGVRHAGPCPGRAVLEKGLGSQWDAPARQEPGIPFRARTWGAVGWRPQGVRR